MHGDIGAMNRNLLQSLLVNDVVGSQTLNRTSAPQTNSFEGQNCFVGLKKIVRDKCGPAPMWFGAESPNFLRRAVKRSRNDLEPIQQFHGSPPKGGIGRPILLYGSVTAKLLLRSNRCGPTSGSAPL